MAFLGKARKIDLLTMIDELGLEAPVNGKVAQLCKVIVESPDYDEEFIKNLLNTTMTQRESMEREAAELKAREEEKEDREFELRKMQLELQAKHPETFSKHKGRDLIKLMSNFEIKDDISIYLALFERQIGRTDIPKENWTSFLLPLLPLEMVNLITREPDTVANNYDEVKKLLLLRFKLHYEQFRQKFYSHRKEPNSSWRDFSFEINRFFEEWLKGLEIETMDDLKQLIVTDQIKRKIPNDIREHFLDEIPKVKKVDELISKIEEYETARNNLRKPPIKESSNVAEKNNRNFGFGRNVERVPPPSRTRQDYYNKFIKCHACSAMGHKSFMCPNKKETNKPSINRTDICTQKDANGTFIPKTQKETNGTFIPKTRNDDKKIHKIIEINNKKINAMLDTGSDVTLTSSEFYSEIGSPPLKHNTLELTGISGCRIKPYGYFNTDIIIDGNPVNTNVYVVEKLCRPFILGIDVLAQMNICLSKGEVTILRGRTAEGDAFSKGSQTRVCDLDRVSITESCGDGNIQGNVEVLCKSVLGETSDSFLASLSDSVNMGELDLGHIVNNEFRDEILYLVNNYKPEKTKDCELQMNIVLTDEKPISCRPRRMSFAEQKIVHDQVQEWLDKGIVRMSNSDFSSAVVLCRKKDGSYRICLDFRRLNEKVIRDRFPLPLIEDVLDSLGRNKVFTCLDLRNGFFHVNVNERSRKYTAFVTHEGQYEFLKMPFGLCTSPSVFQRYVNSIFRDLINDKVVMIYIDDMIIPSKNEEEGLEKLKRVLKRASEYGLELKFEKCQFLKKRIEYLGYVIENGTISPSPGKTLAVQRFPTPGSCKQVQSFLGLTGYFRKFIPQYSIVAKPLSDLLRNNSEFRMGSEQLESFQKLKDALSHSPVLHIYRHGASLELHTDASSHGFGAVLMQKAEDGHFHPLQYMSKKTSPQQEKYTSYELEMLAIVEAVKKFRNYLLGTKFKIITDCDAFKRTLNKKELAPRVARWAMLLEEFSYDVVHRPGSQMKHVDALSRNTVLVVNSSYDEVTQRIAAAQKRDEQIEAIKISVTNGEANNYFIRRNILYKIVNGEELLVVPKAMQTEIILMAHNKGHFGVTKTEEVLKKDFHIPKMKEAVEEVIANCVKCILCNRKRGKGEGLLNPIPKESVPLNTYHVDFIGPLPSTSKKYQHIFTVIDSFTKFVWFYPCKSTTTKEAIEKLTLQQNVFGNPVRIITDKGAAFNAQDFRDYCQKHEIEHIQITTGIPRGNGQIERIHETLIPVLAKLSIEDPTKWYKYVADVQRILNSTITRSTKFTPFELLIGIKMRNQEDQKISEIIEEELFQSIIQERNQLRDEAKINILKIQQENRRQFNRKRKKARVYRVGDLVAIKRTQFGTGLKLRVKFFGPYRVTKVKGHDRYDVEKIGSHEGPGLTSSSADHMKAWSQVLN